MMRNKNYILSLCVVFGLAAGSLAADFGAYYTKVNFGEAFEKFSRTGPHADVVVRNIGEDAGRLVFWRGSSYLPYWEV
ncbi:MAG: hypothetical protein JRD89_17525, partial [Deltaproteobacteria bacterium]|nr:hypothetical protein [Deltaproteobacteria bacterium]